MNPRRVGAAATAFLAFEPEVYAAIEKHTVITNFQSATHARHRLFNMIYKFTRKRATDNGLPDDLASEKGGFRNR